MTENVLKEKNKLKEGELLKPKIDVVFHSLFRVGNEDITKAIISDITKEEIKEITLDNDRYLINEYPEEKLGILDLKAKLDDGVICNIEVQLTNKYDTEKRFLYYWSKIYSGQLLAGDDYKELKKTIGIFILDYELENFKEMTNAHTKWKITEVENEIGRKLILTEDLELHIIEIPKALRILEKEPENKIAQWMLFLSNPNDMEGTNIMQENENIKNAMEKLEEVSQDEKLRRIAELKEKARRDEISGLNGARREGIKEGETIGERKTKLEVAKKMKEEKLPIELIIKITGLEKEEVEKL